MLFKFNSNLTFVISPQCVSEEVALDFKIDHFECSTDDSHDHVGVPEILPEFCWQDDEVAKRVVLQDERAALALLVELGHISVDAEEHSECLLREYLHRLFEILACASYRGTLSCEEIIDHPASHVVPTLLELLVDIFSAVVICFPNQLGDKYSIS